jgi:hypothetical protein
VTPKELPTPPAITPGSVNNLSQNEYKHHISTPSILNKIPHNPMTGMWAFLALKEKNIKRGSLFGILDFKREQQFPLNTLIWFFQSNFPVFFSPYSPKSNAVEYVWKETRRKTTHNRFFKTLSELKQRLFRRFNRFQGNPASLRSVLESFA